MSHMHTQTPKIHHDTNLGETNTFPFIIFFVTHHGGYTQMMFFPRLPTQSFKIILYNTSVKFGTY
jgi:hypothetical protein